MEILQEDEATKGRFFILSKDGVSKAEMTYSKAGSDRIIIDHTEVDDSLRGQGAGKQMVFSAVNYARSKALKIIPLCPFVKSVFDRNPELHDVLN